MVIGTAGFNDLRDLIFYIDARRSNHSIFPLLLAVIIAIYVRKSHSKSEWQ